MKLCSPKCDHKSVSANGSACTNEKDILMASISDLSAAFEGEDLNKKESFDCLMSSIRSIVHSDDFSDELLDSWQDSFLSSASEEDMDYNGSMRNLLTAVNDLLHSRETFTLNESTSLEDEMSRLIEIRTKKGRQASLRPSNNDNSFSLGNSFRLVADPPNDCPVQKQKQKLADVLQDALGAKPETVFASPVRKGRPLNPNRFHENGNADSAPKAPNPRDRNLQSPRNSPHKSPRKSPRKSTMVGGPNKRWDNPFGGLQASKSPRKRPVNVIKFLAAPNLDVKGPVLRQARVPTSLESDATPRQPSRTWSAGRALSA